MNRDKVVSSDEAIALIRDGDVVSFSGFVGIGTPEELITALARRFVETEGLAISRSSSLPPPVTARIGD